MAIYKKKKLPASGSATVTKTDRATGKPSTTTKKLASTSSASFKSNAGKMMRTSKPISKKGSGGNTTVSSIKPSVAKKKFY